MNFLLYESIIEMVYEIADCLFVPAPFNQGNAHLRGVHCYKKITTRGNDMNENTNEKVTEETINTKEFLAKVEEAAREGAKQGSKGRRGISPLEMLKTLILIALIAGVGFMVYRFNNFTGNIKDLVQRDVPVEERDLTLENHGILGYTAADFQEAILGDSKQLKKLEVFTTDISGAATLVDTGLGNLKVFTKTQLMTYKGSVTYTVDLGELDKDDITLDEETKTVHIRIPHAVQEEININENEMEVGDVDRGLLGIGEISTTPEENQKLQSEARKKMQEKLDAENTISEADRFAKMSVWEIYQPIINKVTSGYSLKVDFE